MQESQLAPVERTPSTGFMSAFSTISENNFPSAPAECTAIEIADEVAEIAEERAQIHFRADRCDNQRGEEYYRRQGHLQTLARDRLAIGIVEHHNLLVWKDGYGIRHRDHCAQVLNRTSVKQKKAGSRGPGQARLVY